MAPRYGRAYGSNRATVIAPYQRGNQITMIGAISLEKVEAALYGEWSANGEIFMTFIEEHLCPILRKRHVVVMDNVGFHKSEKVIALIEETGAKCIYLPPYHPELNPIEEMWSKIKTILRKLSARSLNAFKRAIKVAFESVGASDLWGWFQHSGY
jgi:transposase